MTFYINRQTHSSKIIQLKTVYSRTSTEKTTKNLQHVQIGKTQVNFVIFRFKNRKKFNKNNSNIFPNLQLFRIFRSELPGIITSNIQRKN